MAQNTNASTASSTTSTAKPTSGEGASGGGSEPMMLMLIPAAQHQATQAAIRSGCWATLYTEKGFNGDSLTLVGPVELKDMVGPYGLDWDEKLKSIKTGPNTKVTVFDNESFQDRSAQLQPGSSVQEIDKQLGLFEEVQSMSVSCAPPV
jgi:hypothetical protein